MENYKLQPGDRMMIRITNAFVRPNKYDENGRLIALWRNFSGGPTRFTAAGVKRSFVINLNRRGNKDYPFAIEFGSDNPAIGWRPITIEELIEMGWRIDIYDVRKEKPNVILNDPDNYIPDANLEVIVKEWEPQYSYRNPKIFQYVEGRDKPLKMVAHPNPLDTDEIPIEPLDTMFFDRVQIRLNHSKDNKAYLESMHVYPRIDKIPRNYDDWTR